MDPQAIIDNFRRNVTEHYFDMNGRVRRQEFWYFVLASFVVFLGAAIIDGIIHTGLLTAVVGLGLLLPMAGLGARRLQDTGRNGQLVWIWVLLSAVNWVLALVLAISGPMGALGFLYFFFTIGWLINLAQLVISIVLIYFWAQPGTVGPNQYGPDPKGGVAPAAA
ncbi:MAG TPA: DUF805 domain-containing protein [Burkholderiales bacterium]|nr:DUF805 domain-containing protein [Burkholderiales bacterium]